MLRTSASLYLLILHIHTLLAVDIPDNPGMRSEGGDPAIQVVNMIVLQRSPYAALAHTVHRSGKAIVSGLLTCTEFLVECGHTPPAHIIGAFHKIICMPFAKGVHI